MFCTYWDKKYQLAAGTGLTATSIYMIVSGIGSALSPAVMFLISDNRLEVTPYSLILAAATVLSAAAAQLGTMKAYERGQITVVTIFKTIGSVVISCAWGMFFLKEEVTGRQLAAIVLMLLSILIVTVQKNVKVRKSELWLLVLTTVMSSLTSVLTKQHQVEQTYATVNSPSYSFWIGVIRVVVFGAFLLFLHRKGENTHWHFPKKSLVFASSGSLIGGVCYILTLITATVLPITITSPLGTALTIFLTAIMSRVAFREKMTKRQIVGIILCVIAIFIFAQE